MRHSDSFSFFSNIFAEYLSGFLGFINHWQYGILMKTMNLQTISDTRVPRLNDGLTNILPAYSTSKGAAYFGDALELMESIPDDSINLVITSPPFALLRKKEYGNAEQDDYVEWLTQFAKKIRQKLRADGSFVLDLGGAYQRGVPIRSLYNFRVLLSFCDDVGFHLAEDFYWFNPSKLPSPIEWVNKRKVRVKDAVNTVWWFSKSAYPKADVTKVLVPYSGRMKKLIEEKERFFTAKKRPSGHDISMMFAKDNGGAIPPNLLKIPHSESNSKYLSYCKELGVPAHPARFPKALPGFFIKFLTSPGDTVLDIFAGSNTTGEAAEELGRRWLAFDNDRKYLAASLFRFVSGVDEAAKLYAKVIAGSHSLKVDPLRLPI